jgi:hypothetical protein
VQRAGLPETERDMTWPAHVRVEIRRARTSECARDSPHLRPLRPAIRDRDSAGCRRNRTRSVVRGLRGAAGAAA